MNDGPEYTPDGKYVYFNSSRTGTMQLWRMKPDRNQEQVTDDEFNNWFPHISPDGKWIAFLSYGKEVAAEDHPYYKQIYLRLMSIKGGAPKVIAYVYGGQGTINVPSWPPTARESPSSATRDKSGLFGARVKQKLRHDGVDHLPPVFSINSEIRVQREYGGVLMQF